MKDKDNIKKTGQPEELEAVELHIGQLEQVSGGDRGGKHQPPTNPFKPKPDKQ